MSLGSGLPQCWLCKHFTHSERFCQLHEIYIPIEKGYCICENYLDPQFGNKEWLNEFLTSKIVNHKNNLYVFEEYSTYEEYIPFSELKHKDAGSG